MTPPKDYMDRLDKIFGRVGAAIAAHPFQTILALIVLLVGSSYYAMQVRIDNSFDTLFDEGDEAYMSYRTYQDDFGSDEVAYIMYSVEGKEHGLFDLETMQLIQQLTEELEYEVPFVNEVTSITNVEFIEADGDFLEVHRLDMDFPETQEQLLERRDAMLEKPIYFGSLYNKDLTHATIVLEMTRTSTEPIDRLRWDPEKGDAQSNLYPQVSYLKIKEILERPEYTGITFYESGDVIMNNAYNVIIGNESFLLSALSIALVAAISLIAFRLRLNGLLGPVSVVLLGLLVTVGFMGLAGYNMGTLFLIVPTLLIAIGVAQSVHLLEEFNLLRSQGVEKHEAIRQTFEKVGLPCLLAAVTTAAGFFAMSVSRLQALADIAAYMSFGVLTVFVLSITVLPLFMLWSKDSVAVADGAAAEETSPDRMARALHAIAGFTHRKKLPILVVSAAIFAASFAGIAQIHIGFNFIEEFKEHVDFRKDTEVIEDVMGGILNVVYVFDTETQDGIKKASVLQKLEKLQARADEHPMVKKSFSIVDILKDMNQSMHGGDPAYYTLPNDEPLIAQYLLLYEISGGTELDDYVTLDFSRTPLELRVEVGDSSQIEDLIDSLDVYKHELLAADSPADTRILTTGIGLLWVKVANYIADSQLAGYLFAFTMIAIILVLAYRSLGVGALSMIPNLTPVTITLGYMGWADIHLDYFRLLLATIAIGIAVDDTVHMMTRLRREFRRTGNYRAAIDNSITSVGRALTITTMVLTLSFLVFLVSEMSVLASFGILLACTIGVALIADLFLLPALILAFKPFGPEGQMAEARA